MAGGGPLPKNGNEWHAIRQGRLPYIGRYSLELHHLLEQMIHPDPALRPTTQALTQNPVLGSNSAKSKDQLSRELNAERLKNRQLSEKLQGIAKFKLLDCIFAVTFKSSYNFSVLILKKLISYQNIHLQKLHVIFKW